MKHLSPLPSRASSTANRLLIAGLGGRFSYENTAGIPALWQRMAPHFGHVPGQIGNVAYGVSHNCDDHGHFDYIAGVEVSGFGDLPAEFDAAARA